MGLPISPARLAHILKKPIDTAATEADTLSVGSTQNGGGQKTEKTTARHSQAKTAAQGWPGRTLAARNTPVST